MAFVDPSLETAESYAASLTRAVETADTAIRVIDETARIAATAIGLLAICQNGTYEEALEGTLRQIDDAEETGP